VKKAAGNEMEQCLAYQCMADGIYDFEQNFIFDAKRKFEIDLAVPSQKCGIEIQGGIWNSKTGAHGSPLKILRDMEKSNLLVLSGWRILRYSPAQVSSGEAIEGLKSLLTIK
jgi:hypothetical protein